MCKSVTILTMFFAFWTTSAAAGGWLAHQTPYNSKPRAMAAFAFGEKRVEMVAVTRKARADTPLRRAHLNESANMSKVIPGYPQPAFVSVDFRLKF